MSTKNKRIPNVLFFFSGWNPPPPPPPRPPPPPAPKKKKKDFHQIWILCQNSLTRELKIRDVGFVLKKVIHIFVMLIVPHALHCVEGCCFVILPLLTVWHTVLLSASLHPPPPPPHPHPHFCFFSDMDYLSKFTY